MPSFAYTFKSVSYLPTLTNLNMTLRETVLLILCIFNVLSMTY